jgi:methionine-S-sulfoxide reductase
MPGSIRKRARCGDIVTIDLKLTPENGYVPVPLFDTTGIITLVLGWGNYLPGLHDVLQGLRPGETISNLSIDAGWGKRKDELVVTVPKSKLKFIQDMALIRPGRYLHLNGDIQVLVTDVTEDSITVDANPPLAGASYLCDLKVIEVHPLPQSISGYVVERTENADSSRYHVATFALGCFWGAQLAFSREPGVVGTKAGYTQGTKASPTYEQVCEGKTRHREATLVVYDSTVVSYEQLMEVALHRLDKSTDVFNLQSLFNNDDSEQYRHGFYYHTNEQKDQAQAFVKRQSRFSIEVVSAKEHYEAEEYHQHYLLKGGQSARKGTKETIKCYG